MRKTGDGNLSRIGSQVPTVHEGLSVCALCDQSRPLREARKAVEHGARRAGNNCRTAHPEQAGFDSFLKDGDASCREIPNTVTTSTLIESHKSDSFDHSGVQADRNLAFPLDRFRELVARGEIGSLNHRLFSFMCAILRPKRLMAETAPEVAKRLRADGVDVAFLTSV